MIAAAKPRLSEVRERLRSLAHHGRLKPSAVVDDARNPESPLHHLFEWDDTEAAEKYRLHQARRLIARVKVVVTTHRAQVRSVAYVRDPRCEPKKEGYIEVVKVRSKREYAKEVMLNEADRIIGNLRRAENIATVLGVTSELDRLLNAAGLFRDAVEKAAA